MFGMLNVLAMKKYKKKSPLCILLSELQKRINLFLTEVKYGYYLMNSFLRVVVPSSLVMITMLTPGAGLLIALPFRS